MLRLLDVAKWFLGSNVFGFRFGLRFGSLRWLAASFLGWLKSVGSRTGNTGPG